GSQPSASDRADVRRIARIGVTAEGDRRPGGQLPPQTIPASSARFEPGSIVQCKCPAGDERARARKPQNKATTDNIPEGGLQQWL
ncbi:MAG: hypothetical protein ACE5O2_05360, partial [Armatimonadota bacterium]